ncbi:MAG TPA: protein kinase, partial [Polyangiaceae bacterium]|nr:protein kinase [Polyangiaceae bacterium]
MPSGLAVPPAASASAGWGFDLVRRVGEGASSVVWQAIERASGAHVALKIGRASQERARLASEAERLCTVQSPLLSTLRAAGTVPDSLRATHPALAGQPFVALGWCEGSPLLADPVDPAERIGLALAVARDVGQGLADLHATGFAHGDIKPANIIIQRDAPSGRLHARLIDLGLADALASETVSGATPRYLAPEALQHGAGSTAQARDLWALGVTLAETVMPALRDERTITAEAFDAATLPAALGSLIRALLSALPAARPSAQWVSTLARSVLAEPVDEGEQRERWQRAIQQSYLAVRHAELSRAVRMGPVQITASGIAGEWLRASAARLHTVAQLRRGRSDSSTEPQVIADLSVFAQRRWLVHLIGGSAAHFPQLPPCTDDQLAARLLRLAEQRDPRSLTAMDLAGDDPQSALPHSSDRLALVAQLSAGGCSRPVLEAALTELQRPPVSDSFVQVVASAFKRSGEYATALLLFDQVAQPTAQAEAAETARLMGDRDAAQRRLQRLHTQPLTATVASRCAATQARLQFDRAEYEASRSTLQTAPDS